MKGHKFTYYCYYLCKRTQLRVETCCTNKLQWNPRNVITVNVISRLLLSDYHGPAVITLSGFNCIKQNLNVSVSYWWVHRCTQGGGGVRGEKGIKVYPPSKIFAKLVDKNAIKHQKVYPPPKFSQPLYTFPIKLWQKPHGPSPPDFQTMCIYAKLPDI